MITDRLYDLADHDGIEVICGAKLSLNKSISVKDGENLYIGIDDSAMTTSAEERVHLAHELGHCETGSFYNMYSPIDNRGKCEEKANEWAIHNLIPEEDLRSVIASRDGEISVWELSEHFDVTEPFMQKALTLYFKS